RELIDHLNEQFADLSNLRIVNARFEELPTFDCLVCPGSNLGMVDRGIGAAIARYFGEGVREKIRQHIINEYLGEQPVGTAFIQETGDAEHPFLACTPTVRQASDMVNADNIYHAMWATLLAVRKHNGQNAARPINVIACPGLGMQTAQV